MAVQELENQLQALQYQLADLRAGVGTERKVTKVLSVVSIIPEFNGASNTINVYELTQVMQQEKWVHGQTKTKFTQPK
jgi:hypothetical protein